MTEKEFWEELAKHKGEFEFSGKQVRFRRPVIRHRITHECPIHALRAGYAFSGWQDRIARAADDWTDDDRPIRARLCEVLGLEDA